MDWEKPGLTEAMHITQVRQFCISKILHMMTSEQLIRPENWNWTLSLSLYLETPGASCTQRFTAADHQISVYNILLCKIPMSFELDARTS